MKKKVILLTLLICLAFGFFSSPKAQAIDPVTIALLAPVALAVAEKAKPYVIKGVQNGIQGLIIMGKDVIDIFRLPLGMLQATFGIPFGGFSPGVKNLVLGGVAPFKLGFHAAIFPLMLCGVGIN
jgi:hypothetical protein